MLPSSCDWRNSLHFIQQQIRNNRPTVWTCTRPKIKGWSEKLTQANKNPVIAGVSDYYEDYFKNFPSVSSGGYTLKKALKSLVVCDKLVQCQLQHLGCWKGLFISTSAFKTCQTLCNYSFTADVRTSSLLCFSSFEMLSAGAMSPTMHSAISWTKANRMHLARNNDRIISFSEF